MPPVYTTLSAATRFSHALLTSPLYNLTADTARILTASLLAADLRGHPSHGLLRLPSYLERLRRGLITPTPGPTLHRLTPSLALLDAHNTLGAVATHTAVHAACDLAEHPGLAAVAVRNSNHFGAGYHYVVQAVRRGFCCILFTNSSRAMAAWGGRAPRLGVSPIAAGAPAWDGAAEWVLDMAPSVAARGKVHVAARRGEGIPRGWALDAEGRETEDPEAALRGGVMLPAGGYKGSAMAVLMDVFAGVLTGSGFGGKVVGPYDMSGPGNVGHLVVVLKHGLFCGPEEWRERMREVYENVVSSPKADGVDRVWFPGEKEMVECRRREVEGIPWEQAEVKVLNKEADRAGVPHLETSAKKYGVFRE